MMCEIAVESMITIWTAFLFW